jgi:uncharacterized protein (PEP-CTERM system associated)
MIPMASGRARFDPSQTALRLLWAALLAFAALPYAPAQTRMDAASGIDYRAQLQLPTDIPAFGTPANQRTGREWTLGLGAVGSLIFTDNVTLAPPGQEQEDIVLGLSFPIVVRRDGRGLKAQIDYTPTFYQYANTRPSNEVQHNLRSLLTFEPVQDFFFVDATANIQPTYISPLGPRPISGGNVTENQTQQTLVGISPYIRHERSSGWSYLVRNDNLWNTYNTSQLASSFTSKIAADAKSPPARLRYGFDYSYIYTRYESQPTTYSEQVARVRPILAATRRLELSARLGYESNYYFSRYSGAVYGGGLDWTPTPRTKLSGFVEHRFFGPSYGVDFSHRTRLTAWRLNATRSTYTTAEQPLGLQAGTNPQVLNDALRSQIPDAAQRELAVRQLLARLGLPPNATVPYSFFTNQVYLAEQVTAATGIIGKRNTAQLELLWQNNEPISTGGSTLPVGFLGSSGFRQQGFRLTFSHLITAFTNVSLVGTRIYSREYPAVNTAPLKSTESTAYVALSHRLSPKTDASLALRWSNLSSDVNPYRERAVIVVLAHGF